MLTFFLAADMSHTCGMPLEDEPFVYILNYMSKTLFIVPFNEAP